MLKSTHKPSNALTPLPDGWTEHKAPTGHSYFYNATTKTSTYTRPVPTPEPIDPTNPAHSFLQYQAVGQATSHVGPAFNSISPEQQLQSGGRGAFQGHRGGRGGHDRSRDSRPQPTDKPKSRHAIPDCEPWVLICTKYGRRFVYNTEKDQSFWRIPDKLKAGILKVDQLRIKGKAEALERAKNPVDTGEAPGAAERPGEVQEQPQIEGEDSSEYEEVEVTDDEDDGGNPPKRQRTEEPIADQPVEFDEDDIAFQLAAMGQEYGLEQGEYDDGHMEDWEEGAEGMTLSDEDAAALFKDLLNDFGINPYSPWEKLIEEGKLVDDTRYTALTTMKARKEVWEEWTRGKIKQLRELRAKEEKKDPRIPYLAFLQNHATPKLYWPEFKRKYRKEAEMRDTSMTDKDREKFYRDHVNRTKLPQSTLKSDLSTLLKAQPPAALNNSTLLSHLPPAVLADIRFISLDAKTRDPLVEGYITTLPPPPEALEVEESEEVVKEKAEKSRRQKALEDRERHVAEEKRKQRRNLDLGKGRLREEEAEIARAMNVSKKGLMGHLKDDEPGNISATFRSLLAFLGFVYTLTAAQSGPGQFSLTVYQPDSSVHGQAVNAAGSAFYLNTKTLSFCPLTNQSLCPAGNSTIFAGMSALFVEVPGGQQIYTSSAGALSFIEPHSAFIPPGAFIGGFTNITVESSCGVPTSLINWQSPPDNGVVTKGILACPRVLSRANGTAYQIYAKTPTFNLTGCIKVDGLLPKQAPEGVFGAWEYT